MHLVISQPTIGLLTDAQSADDPPAPSTQRPTPQGCMSTSVAHREESFPPLEPFPSKDRKGKQKMVVEPEIAEDEDDDDEEDTDEEMEIFTGFQLLDMDGQTPIGETRQHKLITIFEDPPELYFKDHMAPFRGLMSEMKDQPSSVRNRVVSDWFKENTSRKILAATSGMFALTY